MKAQTWKDISVQEVCDLMTNPYGGVEFTQPSGELNIKSEPLLESVLSTGNVRSAWDRVKANRGAPGIDKISIESFPELTRVNWLNIKSSILEGKYKPLPVRRTEIPKSNGESRSLGIPTVQDRLIQQSMCQKLVPIFDPDFSAYSFGFRPNRSAHDAVRRINEGILSGYTWAVDIDLSKFFDRVNHDLLMARVSRKVKDKRVLKLIGRYLRAGVSVDGVVSKTGIGVPQGGPLSPLLANIMLDDLDKEIERRGHYFSRYADDFVILVNSKEAGERVMNSLRRFIEKKLKLVVNEEKSKVVPVGEANFLGFRFTRGKIRWTDKSFDKFKHNLRYLTRRNWGVSIEYRIKKINQYIRGWMGYYGLSYYYTPLPKLDEWLRRRIRMCIWKQWRYSRTKVRELMKLGVRKIDSLRMAASSKSYWRLSKTFATNLGMNLKWFESNLGLLSIKQRWITFHYPNG